MPDRRCAVCHLRAHHEHHVVYAQHVRKHGGDPDDPRNLMPLCFSCHGAHHNRSRVLPLAALPEPALFFADELLGEYADDYLARYYRVSRPTVEDRHTVTVDGAAGAEEYNRRGAPFHPLPWRPDYGDAA